MAGKKSQKKDADAKTQLLELECFAIAKAFVRPANVGKSIYPGKLGKKIPWREIEDCIRKSNGNPAMVRSFIKQKQCEALALLGKHYGRKKTTDLATAL